MILIPSISMTTCQTDADISGRLATTHILPSSISRHGTLQQMGTLLGQFPSFESSRRESQTAHSRFWRGTSPPGRRLMDVSRLDQQTGLLLRESVALSTSNDHSPVLTHIPSDSVETELLASRSLGCLVATNVTASAASAEPTPIARSPRRQAWA